MRVRVYNRNTHPYHNTFKGKNVTIPAGGFIEMDRSDAVQLKSKMVVIPNTFDGAGNQRPESFSKLELVPVGGGETVSKVTEKFICHATGKEFDSEKEYMAHLKSNEALVEAQRIANEEDENVQKDLRAERQKRSART